MSTHSRVLETTKAQIKKIDCPMSDKIRYLFYTWPVLVITLITFIIELTSYLNCCIRSGTEAHWTYPERRMGLLFARGGGGYHTEENKIKWLILSSELWKNDWGQPSRILERGILLFVDRLWVSMVGGSFFILVWWWTAVRSHSWDTDNKLLIQYSVG